MDKNLEQYLIEAASRSRQQLSADNPYRDIGFDQESPRLGWVGDISFSQIRSTLEALEPLLSGKKNFIFIGMGGSINGIKPLLVLFKDKPFYTLDNLDPVATLEVIKKIENLDETLVVAISKSGTTKETQLLALTLREFFLKRLGQDQWRQHFLWLSDPSSFTKLDALGWADVRKAAIQFDQKTDIGGRFSSPHTLIFILPLFLLLNRDFSNLKDYYNSFISLKPQIREAAAAACSASKDRPDAYFSPQVDAALGDSFSSWIVQLFQESLGSKLDSLAVKTRANVGNNAMFFPLKLDLVIDNSLVSLLSQMYFFQVFIAYYSALRQVNFVTQNFVEKYKQQVRKLEEQSLRASSIKSLNLDAIISEVRKSVKPAQRFIEVVLYFCPQPGLRETIKRSFDQEFPQNQSFIFLGSDWNHQSYQAAFGSKDTFYVILIASDYERKIANISKDTLAKNIKTLQVIAEATHLTLSDKSLFFSFIT